MSVNRNLCISVRFFMTLPEKVALCSMRSTNDAGFSFVAESTGIRSPWVLVPVP